MFHRIKTESTVSERRIQRGMLLKGILLFTSVMLTVFPPYIIAQEFARDVAADVRKDIRSATPVLAITGHVFLDDNQLPTQRNLAVKIVNTEREIAQTSEIEPNGIYSITFFNPLASVAETGDELILEVIVLNTQEVIATTRHTISPDDMKAQRINIDIRKERVALPTNLVVIDGTVRNPDGSLAGGGLTLTVTLDDNPPQEVQAEDNSTYSATFLNLLHTVAKVGDAVHVRLSRSDAGELGVAKLELTSRDILAQRVTVDLTLVLDSTSPVAVLHARPRFVSPGKPVIFNGQESSDNVGIASFSWDFGDGTTASRPITEHSYETVGQFIVTLTVEDEAGNEASGTIEIEVDDSEIDVNVEKNLQAVRERLTALLEKVRAGGLELAAERLNALNTLLKEAQMALEEGHYREAHALTERAGVLLKGLYHEFEARVAIKDTNDELAKLLRLADSLGIELPQELLDKSKTLLAQAHRAFDAGDFDKAEDLASHAEDLLDTIIDRVEQLKETAADAAEDAKEAEERANNAADEATDAADAASREESVRNAQTWARSAVRAANEAADRAQKAAEKAERAAAWAEETGEAHAREAAEQARNAAEHASEAAERARQAARRAGKDATDLNNDGRNNIFDLVYMVRFFNMLTTALAEADIINDINRDGVINILDLVLVAQGLTDGVLIPSFADEAVTAAPLKGMRQDAGFWMSINQETTDTSDNVLRVDLMADGIQELHAFQFDLSFDPATLEVTAVEEGNVLRTDGAETYWYSTGSKAVDTVSAAAARIVSDGISESGVLASVTFKLKAGVERMPNPIQAGTLKIVDANGQLVESVLRARGLTFDEAPVPNRPGLLQNYPNPFNPETWIPYQLTKAAEVTIQIYDITGQVVRTLDLGVQADGFHTERSDAAYWDGRNETGEQVASGVYFYQINAGTFSATRKMLIQK